MIRRDFRISTILTCVLAIVLFAVGYSYFHLWRFDPDRDSLSPDLVARILCPGHTTPPDQFWEDAFTRLGFRTLNPPALARRHSIDYPIKGQYILALGPGDHIVTIYRVESMDVVDVILNSRPPTIHDVHLETTIRSIIDQTKCNIGSIRTAENKPQALPVFLNVLKMTKGWYAEAGALEHP